MEWSRDHLQFAMRLYCQIPFVQVTDEVTMTIIGKGVVQ